MTRFLRRVAVAQHPVECLRDDRQSKPATHSRHGPIFTDRRLELLPGDAAAHHRATVRREISAASSGHAAPVRAAVDDARCFRLAEGIDKAAGMWLVSAGMLFPRRLDAGPVGGMRLPPRRGS